MFQQVGKKNYKCSKTSIWKVRNESETQENNNKKLKLHVFHLGLQKTE
jgi:hypothetical protein